MSTHFDEMELLRENPLDGVASLVNMPAHGDVELPPGAAADSQPAAAPRWRRMAAFLLDLSLFAAMGLVLSPLFPASLTPEEAEHWLILAGAVGFLLLLSYYYFTGSWLIWGKTVGGAIFDVRVVSRSETALDAKSVTTRWLVTIASLLTGGIGFFPALLPGGYSAADRMSATRSVRG